MFEDTLDGQTKFDPKEEQKNRFKENFPVFKNRLYSEDMQEAIFEWWWNQKREDA